MSRATRNQEKNYAALNKKEKRRRKRGSRGAIIIALLTLALVAFLVAYFYQGYQDLLGRPYSNLLQDDSWGRWQGVDYTENDDGTMSINRDRYYAPHMMTYLQTAEAPQEVAVIKARMALDRFTGQALNLITSYTPSGAISLIIKRDGSNRYQLGLLTGHDQDPALGSSSFGEGSNWQDVYLVLDGRENMAYGYVNGNREVSMDWNGTVYPLMEIWLGSFWVGGNNNFGVPVGQFIEYVTVGDENYILANQSFLEYARRELESNPWLWAPGGLAAAGLLYLLLLLLIALARRTKQGDLTDYYWEEQERA